MNRIEDLAKFVESLRQALIGNRDRLACAIGLMTEQCTATVPSLTSSLLGDFPPPRFECPTCGKRTAVGEILAVITPKRKSEKAQNEHLDLFL